MFVLQKHKVIFFHTPKTAGRAVFKAFGFDEGNDTRIQHFLPVDAKTGIFQETWDDYWKFTFVRNPWDRYVSLYEFHKQSDFIKQFNQYSYQLANSHSFDQWMFLNANKFARSSWFGIPQSKWWSGVDTVYRMEELNSAISDIELRVPLAKPFTKDNATVHDHYQTYYAKDTIELVRAIDSDTIDRFGYKFKS